MEISFDVRSLFVEAMGFLPSWLLHWFLLAGPREASSRGPGSRRLLTSARPPYSPASPPAADADILNPIGDVVVPLNGRIGADLGVFQVDLALETLCLGRIAHR